MICPDRLLEGLKVDRKDAMTHLDADLLKPTEIAHCLGVSRSWVYEAAKAGRIPCVRLGGPDGPLRFLRERTTQRSRVRSWCTLIAASRSGTLRRTRRVLQLP